MKERDRIMITLTARQRLDEIRALMNLHDYILADLWADKLYEDFTADNVKLTADEWNELSLYIDTISSHVCG